MFQNKFM